VSRGLYRGLGERRGGVTTGGNGRCYGLNAIEGGGGIKRG
jgi:hypothetical protein